MQRSPINQEFLPATTAFQRTDPAGTGPTATENQMEERIALLVPSDFSATLLDTIPRPHCPRIQIRDGLILFWDRVAFRLCS
jgi:hypothetical protein